MPLTRTLSVYNVLNSKEKKELNIVMLENKKTSLQKLHNIVKSPKKSEKIKEKADLFEQIFDETYSKKKDYLLRNEMRLYHIELKKIISKTHFDQNDELQQQAYINELENRELDDILRFELNKKIAEEEKLFNYFSLIGLYEKQINLKKKNVPISSDIFLDLKESIETELNNTLKFIGESVSNSAYKMSYAERVLLQLNQLTSYSKIIDNENLFKEVFIENLAYLNSLKTKTFQISGEEKIKVLESILVFLKSTKYLKIDKIKETVFAQQSMAIEYMFLGNYAKAIDYFELCLTHKAKLDQNFYFGISINYISTLVKARAFEKASHFILKEKIHKSEGKLKRMLPVIIITFILSGNIEEAEKLMPLKFDKQDLDFYHYLRILHCIILYENKLYELASNEAENLKKHLNSFSEKSMELDNIISDFIIMFVRNEFNYIGGQKIEKRTKLKEELVRFSQQNKKFDSDGLVLLWLKKKLAIEE